MSTEPDENPAVDIRLAGERKAPHAERLENGRHDFALNMLEALADPEFAWVDDESKRPPGMSDEELIRMADCLAAVALVDAAHRNGVDRHELSDYVDATDGLPISDSIRGQW